MLVPLTHCSQLDWPSLEHWLWPNIHTHVYTHICTHTDTHPFAHAVPIPVMSSELSKPHSSRPNEILILLEGSLKLLAQNDCLLTARALHITWYILHSNLMLSPLVPNKPHSPARFPERESHPSEAYPSSNTTLGIRQPHKCSLNWNNTDLKSYFKMTDQRLGLNKRSQGKRPLLIFTFKLPKVNVLKGLGMWPKGLGLNLGFLSY